MVTTEVLCKSIESLWVGKASLKKDKTEFRRRKENILLRRSSRYKTLIGRGIMARNGDQELMPIWQEHKEQGKKNS